SSGGCGPKAGGCGPGGKSATPPPVPPIDRLADGYRVDVLISQARTPVTLTTYLATALARVYLEESVGLKGFPQNEWRSTCELAAVSLGFGVLIANASHIFSKGCGGVRVERSTALTVEESALALALFVALREKTQSFKAEMAATQQSAFSEATLWTDSNQKVINRLKRDPAEVARDDMLELREAKPWLARVLGLGRRKRSSEVFDDEGLSQFESEMKERSSGATKRRAKASSEDLRALVDESLEGVRAAREHAARLAQQR
ncbi:MAG: hypothetical protein FWD57_15955, partial [Polyangiaceae bacterium]|nr:hypothetical protein [Polyangiaceae bacterium]